VALALAPVVTVALLNVGFSDDFETGALWVGDGGQWDTVRTFFPATTLRTAPAAGHRGNLGLRVVDGNGSDAGNSEEAWLIRQLPGFGADLWLRYWVRQSFQGIGSVQINHVDLDPTGGADRCTSGTAFRLSSGGLQLGGYGAAGSMLPLLITPADAGLAGGTWHLLEMATTGVGTADGGRALWLDGRFVGGAYGLDFTTCGVRSVSMGENFAVPSSSTGTLDFDDVAVSAAPNATWLSASVAGPVIAGECAVVEVRLEGVTRLPAPAAYDVAVALPGAGAQLFADPACTVPATGLTVAAGDSRATAGMIISEPGDYVLAPLHLDLLSTTFPVKVMPGAPRRLGVGCSLVNGPPALAALAALCALTRLRARGRRRGAP